MGNISKEMTNQMEETLFCFYIFLSANMAKPAIYLSIAIETVMFLSSGQMRQFRKILLKVRKIRASEAAEMIRVLV
jgi:hypothetical protein